MTIHPNKILENEINLRCHIWQLRLGLKDWDVSVKILQPQDFEALNINGTCEYDLREKQADIKLVHPDSHSKDKLRPYQMEETLIHELLHLHVAPFAAEEYESEKAIAQEQMINLLARCLFRLGKAVPDASN